MPSKNYWFSMTDSMSPSIYLRQLEVGPMQNFVYLIGDPRTRDVVLVDPGWEPDTLTRELNDQDLRLNGILITHTHFDHVNGLAGVLKKVDVPVYVHEKESSALKDFSGNLKPVRGEDALKIGDVTLKFLHTPGHTPGSQCFLVENNLVSGDTLFINYCGRCDLPGGDIEEMYQSLSRLKTLDDKVILCPGHNYADKPTTTLGAQKKANPYLKSTSLQSFLSAMRGLLDE